MDSSIFLFFVLLSFKNKREGRRGRNERDETSHEKETGDDPLSWRCTVTPKKSIHSALLCAFLSRCAASIPLPFEQHASLYRLAKLFDAEKRKAMKRKRVKVRKTTKDDARPLCVTTSVQLCNYKKRKKKPIRHSLLFIY
jgi:hypothetical protein